MRITFFLALYLLATSAYSQIKMTCLDSEVVLTECSTCEGRLAYEFFSGLEIDYGHSKKHLSRPITMKYEGNKIHLTGANGIYASFMTSQVPYNREQLSELIKECNCCESSDIQGDITDLENLLNNHISNDLDRDPNNEIQDISLTNDVLSITDGSSVDLSAYNSSDDQTISTDGTAGNISIENGNTISLNVNDADADPTNEIQDLQLTGNILTITDNGAATNIDLSTYLDNTDDQQITDFSLTGNTLTITLEDGGTQSVDLGNIGNPTDELDTFTTSDGQTIVNGSVLQLTDQDPENELDSFYCNGWKYSGDTVCGDNFYITNNCRETLDTLINGSTLSRRVSITPAQSSPYQMLSFQYNGVTYSVDPGIFVKVGSNWQMDDNYIDEFIAVFNAETGLTLPRKEYWGYRVFSSTSAQIWIVYGDPTATADISLLQRVIHGDVDGAPNSHIENNTFGDVNVNALVVTKDTVFGEVYNYVENGSLRTELPNGTETAIVPCKLDFQENTTNELDSFYCNGWKYSGDTICSANFSTYECYSSGSSSSSLAFQFDNLATSRNYIIDYYVYDGVRYSGNGTPFVSVDGADVVTSDINQFHTDISNLFTSNNGVDIPTVDNFSISEFGGIVTLEITNDGAYTYVPSLFDSIAIKTAIGASQLISTTSSMPYAPIIVDIDLDFTREALWISGDGTEAYYQYNINGLGEFGLESVLSSTSNLFDLAMADFNGDGFPDAALKDNDGLGVYLNTGGFFNGTRNQSISIDARYINTGDFDGDGDIDIMSLDQLPTFDYEIILYLNDGTGSFTPRTVLGAGFRSLSDLKAADLDGDGDLDIVLKDFMTRSIFKTFVNDGSGNFTEENTFNSDAGRYFDISDVDLDGDIDIIEASKIHYNDGSGNFLTNYTLSAPNGSQVAIGDITGDGLPDVVVAPSDGLYYFENTGSAFTDRIIIDNNQAFDVNVGDIDNDGILEVIATLANQEVRWYQGPSPIEARMSLRELQESPDKAFGLVTYNYDIDGNLINITDTLGNEVEVVSCGASEDPTNELDTFTTSDGQTIVNGSVLQLTDQDPENELDSFYCNGWKYSGDTICSGRGFSLHQCYKSSTAPSFSYTARSFPNQNYSVKNYTYDGITYNVPSGSIQAYTTGDRFGNGNITKLNDLYNGLSASFLANTGLTLPDISHWNASFPSGNNFVLDIDPSGAYTYDPNLLTDITFVGDVQFGPLNLTDAGLQSNYVIINSHYGDFDNDGDIDHVETGVLGGGFTPSIITYFENTGDNLFTEYDTIYYTGLMKNVGLSVIIDLDGDDNLDIVFHNDRNNRIYVLRGLGDGTFAAEESIAPAGDLKDMIAVDIDQNGDKDLIFVSDDDGDPLTPASTVTVYYSFGGIALPFPSSNSVFMDFGSALGYGDYDSDGDLDLLVYSTDRKIHYLENNAGFFTSTEIISDVGLSSLGRDVEEVFLYDVDGDFNNDIIIDYDSAYYYKFDGVGYTRTQLINTISERIYVGDIDDDGDPDVLHKEENSSYYINDGFGNFTAYTLDIFNAQNAYLFDVDQDGYLDWVQYGQDVSAWARNTLGGDLAPLSVENGGVLDTFGLVTYNYDSDGNLINTTDTLGNEVDVVSCGASEDPTNELDTFTTSDGQTIVNGSVLQLTDQDPENELDSFYISNEWVKNGDTINTASNSFLFFMTSNDGQINSSETIGPMNVLSGPISAVMADNFPLIIDVTFDNPLPTSLYHVDLSIQAASNQTREHRSQIRNVTQNGFRIFYYSGSGTTAINVISGRVEY